MVNGTEVKEELRTRFYKVYNKIPLGIRDEPILVIEDEPISWRVARIEIDSETPSATEILEKLALLEII